MLTYIAAISGGVDSVVLLDMLSKGKDKVIVAHVDHGIRDDSADDARFVRGLAQKYGYIYKEKRLNLGPAASEEQARQGRYEFLFELAGTYDALIVTAHHGDDLAETIAINLRRGTGWRGVAVLNRDGIVRPMLAYCKADMYDYALTHHLEWAQDKSNLDHRYLRNRLRAQLRPKLTRQTRDALVALRRKQASLAQSIGQELSSILSQNNNLRHLLTCVDSQTGTELLGAYIFNAGGVRPTRPQLERALVAVKTAKSGTTYHVGSKIKLRFLVRDFLVEVL